MKKLKIGVLGLANIAQKAIIPAIMKCNRFDLYGIASRNIANKNKIEEEYLVAFYEDYQKMVDDPMIDALYIPLPNSLHFPWVKKALQKGKDLLVEKSLACSLKDVTYLNDLAEQNNLALVENFQFRKHKQLKIIKEIINDNKVGEIRTIRSSFGFPPFPDKDNIRYKKDLGGGALLDAGAYPIKIAQEILGRDLNITSALLAFGDSEVDIWGSGMLQKQQSSQHVQFSFGFDNHYQCSLEIWGSKGKLFTNRIFTAPPDYEPAIQIETGEGLETIKLESDNQYVNMLEHFYDCVHDFELKTNEYKANVNQSRLLEGFYNLAYQSD